MGPEIVFSGAGRHYGTTAAIDDVDLSIAAGSFVAVVGESGSGKSTLLRAINRLDANAEHSGRVTIAGTEVDQQEPAALRRRIGYVFQSIGLFPHMTVAQNVAIGPRVAGERLSSERIAELLEQAGLPGDIAGRFPRQLSGGQQQRVGLARALAIEPQILLLDEPFAALDPVTRDALGRTVRAIHDARRPTTLLVTHDMAEAMLLADRVIVMRGGRIVADATPEDLATGHAGPDAEALVSITREQARRIAALAQ